MKAEIDVELGTVASRRELDLIREMRLQDELVQVPLDDHVLD